MLSLIIAALLALNHHGAHQPMNARCANSEFMTADIFPTAHGSLIIAQISKITDENRGVVGWAFRTTNGEDYAQANKAMSPKDLALAVGQSHISGRLSGIFRLHGNPWPDLRITPCLASEMRAGKYNPWRPQDLPQ